MPHNTARKFAAPGLMSGEELRGHIYDVLDLSLSNEQTVQRLLARSNGAGLERLLTAALAVAREQVDFRKAEHRDFDAREKERERAEARLRDLRGGLKKLLAEELP